MIDSEIFAVPVFCGVFLILIISLEGEYMQMQVRFDRGSLHPLV